VGRKNRSVLKITDMDSKSMQAFIERAKEKTEPAPTRINKALSVM
jgi:hypothetical protein